jgi:hypothetical protein
MNRPALARLLCFAVTVNGGSALLAQAPSSSLERARQGAGFSLPPPAAPASPPHSPMPAPPVAAPQVRPVPPPVVPAGAKPPIAQTQPPVKLQAQASMPSAGTIRANSLAIPQWLKEMLDKMARENAAAAQARNRLFETGAGTVASVGAASAAEKTARRLGTDTLGAAKLLEPGIVMVNRRTKEFLVTPGGYLTIDGRGFGDTLGQVNVIGRFPGGKAALQVVDWRDTQIYALLPVGLRGAPDQVATLQVVTRQARTYRRDRANFVAAREVITFTNGIDRLVQAKAKNMDSDGSVSYRATGVNCPDLETVEDFRFTLPAGWMPSVIGLEPGRSDTGDGDADGKPGRREFFGQYAIGNWDGGNRFQISSGVWRSRNLAAARSARFAGDTCVRSYRLSVAVMGPAGLSPF